MTRRLGIRDGRRDGKNTIQYESQPVSKLWSERVPLILRACVDEFKCHLWYRKGRGIRPRSESRTRPHCQIRKPKGTMKTMPMDLEIWYMRHCKHLYIAIVFMKAYSPNLIGQSLCLIWDKILGLIPNSIVYNSIKRYNRRVKLKSRVMYTPRSLLFH